MKTRRAVTGVTLVELLIAMAIVAVLARLAVPTYQGYIRKAQRQVAGSCLMEIHRKMQVYNQNRASYPTTLTSLGYASTPVSCPESSYVVALETYDRLSAADCGSTARYQLRATSQNTSQAVDGSLVLGFCNNPNPNRRLIRDRILAGNVVKPWDGN